GGVMHSAANLSTLPPTFVQPELFQDLSSDRADNKSVSAAVGLSLLLPGMGELYAGNYKTGKYFTASEGFGWIALFSFNSYATWQQSDAHSFAVQHAGVNPNGKADQFFIDISNFASMDAFNTYQLQQRNVSGTYSKAAGQYWKWDNSADQQKYIGIRESSDIWFSNARFVVAAIVANHIVSAIDAARSAITHNRNLADVYHIEAGLLGTPGRPNGIALSLTRTF
ncbi:MAG TPA: hypothetical protein VKS81_03115, partial [Bacteroidota bacterium]|nr:hypothetical protein [Bacteroidota bacterium]